MLEQYHQEYENSSQEDTKNSWWSDSENKRAHYFHSARSIERNGSPSVDSMKGNFPINDVVRRH